MKDNVKLQPEERLNSKNFEEWEFLIKNILESEQVLEYIKSDVISEINTKLEEAKGSETPNEATIKDLENQVADAKMKNALATTIISTNVSFGIVEKIKGLKSAYAVMKKLTVLYGKRKSSDIQFWMKKMNTMKAKTLYECKGVITELNEIFEKLAESNVKLSDLEKIRIFYLAFPKVLREQIHPTGEEKVEQFLEEVLKIINFQVYIRSTVNIGYKQISDDKEDLMEIDDINGIDSVEKEASNLSRNKYCHICKTNSHTTDSCRHNNLTKKNKKHTDNKRNNNNRKQRRRDFKRNQGKNERKSMNNIQYEQEPSEEISLDNLECLYQQDIDNIERIDEIEIDQENQNEQSEREIIEDPKCISFLNKENPKQTVWTFDTGASEHITNNKNILEDFREKKIILKCANNSLCEFSGVGNYTAVINGYIIKLENVLYSEHVNKNLLSGIKLIKNGINCHLKSRKNKVYLTLKLKNNQNKTINLGTFSADDNNIIHIQLNNHLSNYSFDNITEDETIDLDDQSRMLWHKRLGHFYHDNINNYLKLHNIKPVKCFDCKIAKLNRKTHKGETPKATQVLETIHSDVMGPINPMSFTGKKFILTFIDEFSRKSWIFLLVDKKEIPKITINFFMYLENQCKQRIKRFHTDHGTEYDNKKIIEYCKRNGILKTFSPPHSPQNNGLAERFNYTVVSCARTLLHGAQMDINFWDYAVKYACMLYNITPHKGINKKIPNEVFYNKKVDLKYIKVFGCRASYKDFSQKKGKFESKGRDGVFLGFNNESYCYIIMDLEDLSIHLVNEVTFNEQTPSALKIKKHVNDQHKNLLNNDNYIYERSVIDEDGLVYDNNISNNILYNEADSYVIAKNKVNTQSSEDTANGSTSNLKVIEISDNNKEETFSDNNNQSNLNSNSKDDDTFNRERSDTDNNSELFNKSSKRKYSIDSDSDDITAHNKRLNCNTYPQNHTPLKRKQKDYSDKSVKKQKPSFNEPQKRKCDSTDTKSNKKQKPSFNESTKRPNDSTDSKIIKKSKFTMDNITKPNNHYQDNSNNTSTEYSKIDTYTPLTYKQAITCNDKDQWIKAMNAEINNFYDNKIMTFVKSLPPGIKPTSTKWVYTIKKDGQGNIIKYKARLVARGFTQKKGVDYDLTYSPTLSIDSLKLIIALASKFKWELMQLDIKAAYLNAALDKNIYVNIPPGDINFGKGFWLLNKALYGLKQSGRQWNIHFTNFLKNNGFTQLRSEPCIFAKKKGGKVVCIIGVYVDDLLITGVKHYINITIKNIKENFKISKCNKADYIIGINIEKENSNYSISQTQLINDLMQKFKITNIRKAKTPCSTITKSDKNDKQIDKTTFKSAIGSLIYLSRCTRPDITFAVGKVARNSENPTIADWKMVINILKYLNYTKHYKITYKGQGEIRAYTDSDFAGDPRDRKSTSGYIILMDKDPISWQSKKQTVVATSTAEAEYIATSECTKKVLWFRNILNELFNINKPIKIFTDNLASKTSIENGELNNKLKHIEIKFYFNKENIKNNKIALEYINTEKMLADPLTKDFNSPKMTKFTDQIFNKKTFWSEGEC